VTSRVGLSDILHHRSVTETELRFRLGLTSRATAGGVMAIPS
jgi:hypothetical protein